ncbi:putative aldouronate transport system permease protein [Bacillus niacini]|uniref:Aldouronate transport system permease protein n=1 Tax=Neobacillus niacini TaxID=86668 RepID=A0A852T3S2_9BACI|nr:carbohydrate ABC transporter permease [Neobacillus niacini]MEC1522066.1 carbohydrate ABC transporter permease [Neobacillus niacini]NYE03330.1 putative aldouronate transport system permease protein [Neobacillus niacini]
MKRSFSEKLSSIFIATILILLSIVCLYPFVYVFSASFSSGNAVITGEVLLFPKDITLDSYKSILAKEGLWQAYGNTVFYTVAGTAFSILLTICGAYPLSKSRLVGRTFVAFFIAFTLWFGAGLIPTYLNFKELGLLDTRTSIIVGFAVSAFLVILLRTFFQSIPDSLEESAKMDGANDLQILRHIYLPLSKPALVTVGLIYAVGKWNSYFWAMVLLNDESKIPLQVLLKKMIVEMSLNEELTGSMNAANAMSQETFIYATIIVSILPIVLVYPFLQKYFVKGTMIGGIKE